MYPSSATVIIAKNLNPDWNEMGIRRVFEEYGTIISFDIPLHRNGKRKDIAFIEYSTPEEANSAILGLNNKRFDEKVISVEKRQHSLNKIYISSESESEEEDTNELAYIKYPRRDLTGATDNIPRPATPPTPPPSPPPVAPPIELLREIEAKEAERLRLQQEIQLKKETERSSDYNDQKYSDKYKVKDKSRDKDRDRHHDRDKKKEKSHNKDQNKERRHDRDKDRDRERRHDRDREKERSRSPSRYVRDDRTGESKHRHKH